MKQTLLDRLFYNQDKWQECEKRIAKYNAVGNILWVCNLVIMLNSSFVSPKHVLVNVITICYFVLTLIFTIYIVIKRNKLYKERQRYGSKYYDCMDELVKSKIVEVHDEQES